MYGPFSKLQKSYPNSYCQFFRETKFFPRLPHSLPLVVLSEKLGCRSFLAQISLLTAGLSSELFNVGGYEWKIDFLPDGEESNSIFASVYLVLASNVTNVRALFELTLVDRSGKGRHDVRRNYDVAVEDSDPSIFTSKRHESEVMMY